MNPSRRVLLLTALLLPVSCAFGQNGDILSRLPEAAYPLGEDATAQLAAFGDERGLLRTRPVEVEGMPFKQALEIEVTGTAKYVHQASLAAPTAEPVRKGDILFLSFYTKCIRSEDESGQGLVLATFRREWRDRAFESEFYCPEDWTLQHIRGRATRDYEAGEAGLRFFIGYRPQKVLIADVRLRNYQKDIDYDDLPVMPVAYAGMEPRAQWREDAMARIEKHRKSDITVVVRNASGRPVDGAEVSITLSNLAFGIGGPYQAGLYRPDRSGFDVDTYQDKFKLHFNKAVLPNAMKWKQYPTWGKIAAPKAVAWLSENNIPVRGHCLIWPGWKYLPKELEQHKNDPERLRQLATEHIEEMLTPWRGKFVEWDVVNEVYMQHAMLDVCGKDALVDWFKLARKLDPDTKLTYNDANTLVNNQPGHQDHYYETIQWLRSEGAPVDVMGFQGHIHSFIPPEATYKRIERFAELGPAIEITEFDILKQDVSDEMASRYARDFMIAVFSHPKTIGIITWLGGNPLRRNSVQQAYAQTALYDENWNITPMGQVWLDLKTKEWHTDASGTTDSSGAYKTRGFHGEYNVTVTKDGKTATTAVDVGNKDMKAELTL
jgi:endo-1,4-beta-xylanase